MRPCSTTSPNRICTITLNRPEKLNAWTRQMHFDLKDAMRNAGADPDVRAIILTGAGRRLLRRRRYGRIAGNWRRRLGRSQHQGCNRSARGSTLAEFRMSYSYFPAIPKFIIAAINGPAAAWAS